MQTVLWAVVLGLLAFAVHVVIWRIRRPRNSGVALLAVFVAVAALGAAVFAIWIRRHGGSMHWPALAQVALLYFAGMAAYINTYPAIEADSPSLLLMQELHRAGEAGLAREEIMQIFNEQVVLKPRVLSLLDEKMAVQSGARINLTARGRLTADIFWYFRKLTGRPLGG